MGDQGLTYSFCSIRITSRRCLRRIGTIRTAPTTLRDAKTMAQIVPEGMGQIVPEARVRLPRLGEATGSSS